MTKIERWGKKAKKDFSSRATVCVSVLPSKLD